MAETFVFKVADPVGGEVAAYQIDLYESADGLTGWAVVDTVVIATLTPDGDGVYTWASTLADSAKYHQLVPVSASGIDRPGAVVVPPRPSDPNSFKVYCYTVDIGLGIAAGVPMAAMPGNGVYAVTSAASVAVTGKSTTTDATGYAELTLPADAGEVSVTIGKKSTTINTEGRGGTSINLATLL